MKTFKKIISSVLSISSVMAMLSVNSMALGERETNVSMYYLADTLSFQLDLYYDNGTMELLIDNGIYLGSTIPAYYEDETGNTEIYTQAVYYPVYSNGDIIGIFNVYHGDENDTYSYSEYLGDELNEYKSLNPIMFINDDEERIIPGGELKVNSCYTDKTADLVKVPVSNEKANLTRSTSPSKILSVQSWDQTENGYTPLCRAGSMWSIGEYVNGSTYDSPNTIVNELNNRNYDISEVYASDVINYLNDLYGITTTQRGVLTHSAIKTTINNDNPAYMGWDYLKKGHATVLCGYKETDTRFGIRVMDPYGGLFRVVSVSSNSNTYTMAVNGHTYTWARSLVVQ